MANAETHRCHDSGRIIQRATDMTYQHCDVSDVSELLAAVADSNVSRIHVKASLSAVPAFRLSPGQMLHGVGEDIEIAFEAGSRGIQLSTDNHVENLALAADADQPAVYNDATVGSLGRIVLHKLRINGCVELLATGNIRAGHVEARDIDIVQADARGGEDRPKGFGVEVIPGAFTLWNKQADPSVTITADLTHLNVGRAGAPVQGSGIFVSGAGDTGGRLVVQRLETGAVYSDGGIVPGTADRISAGVFVVYGALVNSVRNLGPVTTYGSNDMVLDNWGAVDQWLACEAITSFGPSSIGFVNFGTIDTLELNAPIETFGQGSRGFNVYAGTVRNADFDRIVTHADGAVGIQLSQPVGRITVRRGIETFGGIGDSLVKGVVVKLAAHPLSIKPGGSVQALEISGGLIAHGAGVGALDLQGVVQSFRLNGGISSDKG
jgi:hypothetical protein